jgi:hypothetical protein
MISLYIALTDIFSPLEKAAFLFSNINPLLFGWFFAKTYAGR